jgi:phosphoribosylcarboxyaminoimidazole (NCAIR) mutase
MLIVMTLVTGMVASLTALPVIGVPVKTSSLSGMDSLLSIVQVYTLLFVQILFGKELIPN